MTTRRRALVVLGLAAFAPGFAWAQTRKPVVGVLFSSPRTSNVYVEAFHRDLAALGWVDGRNVELLLLWPEGRSDALPELATKLSARGTASGRTAQWRVFWLR